MMDVSHKLNNSWIWDVEAFSEEDQVIYLPARVCAIHAVAYLNEGDQADIARPPGNHWVFIVDLVPPSSVSASLRFSMESGESSKYAGSLNLAMMASVDSDAFGIHARRTSGEFMSAVSLQEVLGFMMQNHLDCYKFTDHHEGCAYWVSSVLKRFADMRWIRKEMSEGVDAAIQLYYPDRRGKYGGARAVSKYAPGFDGVVKGSFFIHDNE
ncbi:hypothetical protein BDZ89DRAFT_1145360 [Hymenopellis radicata]|nr:hypothetical protein BDZ89DRAFT_1145360 [Hymenopellis radicata]